MALRRWDLTALSDTIPGLLLLALAACTEDDLRRILSNVDEGKRRDFFTAFQVHNPARSYRLLRDSLASASEERREFAAHLLGAAVGGPIRDSLATADNSSASDASAVLTRLVDRLGLCAVRLGLLELVSEADEVWPAAGALLLNEARLRLPGWPAGRDGGEEVRPEVDAQGPPLANLEPEGQPPTWHETDDRFVADIIAPDPILDRRHEQGPDSVGGLLARLIDALDGSLADTTDAADRVATAVREGTAPSLDDLGSVVAFGRRFAVAETAAGAARRVAALSEAEPARSLDSLRATAQQLVEYQIGLAIETCLRRIGQTLDGPAALAGRIAEVRASADRLAPAPESDPSLRDGLLALANLIELANEDGAWQEIDRAEGQARAGLRSEWGPVIVAAIRGTLRLQGVVTPYDPRDEALRVGFLAGDQPRSHPDDDGQGATGRSGDQTPSAGTAAEATAVSEPMAATGSDSEPIAATGSDSEPTAGSDSQVAAGPESEETVDVTEPAQPHRPRPGEWAAKREPKPWVTNRTRR